MIECFALGLGRFSYPEFLMRRHTSFQLPQFSMDHSDPDRFDRSQVSTFECSKERNR